MKCCVCGVRDEVVKLRVSENFVSYSDLFVGNGLCNVCARLFSDRKLRSSSWILVNNEFTLLDKKNMLKTLRDPPINGLIYVKSTGRRYGFLKCMKYYSTNTHVALCGEDEGLIFVNRSKLKQLVEIAEKAHSLFKTKKTLLNGCSTGDWVYEDICRVIENIRGDPAWPIVVRAL